MVSVPDDGVSLPVGSTSDRLWTNGFGSDKGARHMFYRDDHRMAARYPAPYNPITDL